MASNSTSAADSLSNTAELAPTSALDCADMSANSFFCLKPTISSSTPDNSPNTIPSRLSMNSMVRSAIRVRLLILRCLYTLINVLITSTARSGIGSSMVRDKQLVPLPLGLISTACIYCFAASITGETLTMYCTFDLKK